MAENSKIEWTDHTFNPWIGCTRVSEGCRHCYAETLMDTRWGKVQWGPQGERLRTSEAKWREPMKWNERAMRDGRRYRVFCASLADVFEDKPEVAPWRDELFALMAYTKHLDWQVLTKRPENVLRMVPESWHWTAGGWPQHVWIGTSVENQEMADKRIPELWKIPAAVRFLSCEPLLGQTIIDLDGIHWVIVGGESGPGARPMHPDWARSLRDQCVAADVAYFFKQWGEYVPRLQLRADQVAGLSNAVYANAVPIEGDQAYRVGKRAAGRLLDGREWSEFPNVTVTA